MNSKIKKLIQEIIRSFANGSNEKAKKILNDILQIDTTYVNIIFELGIEYAKKNQLSNALTIFQFLESKNKKNLKIQYNIGLIYSLQNKPYEAIHAYDLALKIQPNDVMSLINQSSIYSAIGKYNNSLECVSKAIELDPNLAEAWHNKGVALNNLQLISESIESYRYAVNLNDNYFEAWSNLSLPLLKSGQFLEAINACDKALTINPCYPQAWFNKGNILYDLRKFEEAITHFDKALEHKNDYVEAWSNKGSAFFELKKFDKAMTNFVKALSLNVGYAQTWFNKALLLSELQQYDQAITHFEKAMELNQKLDWVRGELLHTKMKICDWKDLKEFIDSVSDGIMKKERIIHPFQVLSWCDDLSVQKQASEIFAKNYQFNNSLGSISRCAVKSRIKIAYFSSDFYNHPTSYLINEFINLHDRGKFEITAFSYSPIVNDQMQCKLRNAFDQFIDVSDNSDIQIAEMSRSLLIDIAIDLKGYTQNSRSGIFSYRAAPIQVNYLGYPGTLASDYIDYIIADQELIPFELRSHYSEKIVFLPFSYQPNDRERKISKSQFIRSQWGLPKDAFVFCCFNNNYKILPSTFDGWMRILSNVDDSVLWLLEDNKWVSDNLKKEALKRGVSDKRLIFAGRIQLPEHLARHHCADLFLDTFPYNAHTTSSDALWTGLPVLTLSGQSFASRVSASLLNAVGLPELVTKSQEEYEELAICLASDPRRLAEIKSRLITNRLNLPLFNTSQFTKNIESAYVAMFERYQAGRGPEHLFFSQ